MSFLDSIDLSPDAISSATGGDLSDLGTVDTSSLGSIFDNVSLPSAVTPSSAGSALTSTSIGGTISSLASDATKAISSIFGAQATLQAQENALALAKAQGQAAVAKASQPPLNTNVLLLAGAGLAALMIFSNGKK